MPTARSPATSSRADVGRRRDGGGATRADLAGSARQALEGAALPRSRRRRTRLRVPLRLAMSERAAAPRRRRRRRRRRRVSAGVLLPSMVQGAKMLTHDDDGMRRSSGWLQRPRRGAAVRRALGSGRGASRRASVVQFLYGEVTPRAPAERVGRGRRPRRARQRPRRRRDALVHGAADAAHLPPTAPCAAVVGRRRPSPSPPPSKARGRRARSPPR